MANGNAAWAMAKFIERPTVTISYLRRDGEYTVWLPQDKKTWRIDDKYGVAVTGPNGRPVRFMSRQSAMIAAAAL